MTVYKVCSQVLDTLKINHQQHQHYSRELDRNANFQASDFLTQTLQVGPSNLCFNKPYRGF